MPIPWDLARSAAGAGRRIILSAGLTPDNVAEAIRVTRPFAVDVNSGVEARPGRKDPDKVRRFVAAAAVAPRRSHEARARRAASRLRRRCPTRPGTSAASAGASCPRR